MDFKAFAVISISQDRCVTTNPFQPIECLFTLLGPLNPICLFLGILPHEQLVKRFSNLSVSSDELPVVITESQETSDLSDVLRLRPV